MANLGVRYRPFALIVFNKVKNMEGNAEYISAQESREHPVTNQSPEDIGRLYPLLPMLWAVNNIRSLALIVSKT